MNSSAQSNGDIFTADMYNNLRLDVMDRDWQLKKASGVTVLAGYMSTAQKQAATITMTVSGGSLGSPTNFYDGNLDTYASVDRQNNHLYTKIDFGSDVVLDQIDIVSDEGATYRIDNYTVYGSSTGAFAGEETTVATVTNGAAAVTTEIAFTAAQYRYWKIDSYGDDSGNIGFYNEINFHYGTSLAIMGVPWGCEVELWNGASSVDAQTSESLTKPGLVEFSVDVSSVDGITITEPDGTTAWLDFAESPDNGDVYSLFKAY